MADAPSSPEKDKTTDPPAPEVLKPQADDATQADETNAPAAAAAPKPGKRLRRGSYRPSHKATFIGLAVVVAILAINAGIIAFVLKSQSKSKSNADQGQVTVSQAALDKLGVNRSPVGDSGIELTVNPNARFNGNLQVGGDVSIAGKLQLNGPFSATSATFTNLNGGDTSLDKVAAAVKERKKSEEREERERGGERGRRGEGEEEGMEWRGRGRRTRTARSPILLPCRHKRHRQHEGQS